MDSCPSSHMIGIHSWLNYCVVVSLFSMIRVLVYVYKYIYIITIVILVVVNCAKCGIGRLEDFLDVLPHKVI